ncbi:6-phosphogluconolactonase [Candidatus Parcubacteria bacterium]|nr:6-phosphogluconolactonase [Candidatus Parcubacteria bacterium]
MRLIVAPNPSETAAQAAQHIAELARDYVNRQGRFWLAVSGGGTPALMFAALADMDLPWSQVHVAQVDERVAPEGSPDRNWTGLREHLLSRVPVPSGNRHPMPVTAGDPERAGREYAGVLRELMGGRLEFDLVHLGLGDDGHTASLVPGDPVLDEHTRDVALTAPYRGHRRLTLTWPALNRAKHILWLVCGPDKAPMLARLQGGDRSIPAGRVDKARAVVFSDRAAAG